MSEPTIDSIHKEIKQLQKATESDLRKLSLQVAQLESGEEDRPRQEQSLSDLLIAAAQKINEQEGLDADTRRLILLTVIQANLDSPVYWS